MADDLKNLRIVFMGTPEFAVASLEALVKAKYNIAGVITAPDKPAGRGLKMQESAVKKYASKRHLKILQPEKLKNPGIFRRIEIIKCRLTNSSCFSHASRSSMEYAAHGNR
jgi:methionyl-tRNA formyltransferase